VGGGTSRVMETSVRQADAADGSQLWAWMIVAGGDVRFDATGTALIATAEILNFTPLSILGFGGHGDAAVFVDGSIALGSSTFNSPSSTFSSSSVGKLFLLYGAGPNGGVLSTTISAYVSAHVVTLASTASTAVTSAKGAWGSDNSAAIAQATFVATAGGWRVDFPEGIYLTSQTGLIDRTNISLHGGRQPSTILYSTSGTIEGYLKRDVPVCNEAGCQ